MPGLLRKYGGERVAMILASEDGKNWDELTPEEKEMYYSKAYQKKQDQQTTRPAGQKPKK